MRSTLLALFAAAWLPLAPPAHGAACPGDCSGDGVISVDELVVGVERALGIAAPAACPAWREPVTIADLVAGVGLLLAGCPPAVTPTGTPTITPAPPLPTDTVAATPTASGAPDPIARAFDAICPRVGFGYSRSTSDGDNQRSLRCEVAGHWTEVGLRRYDSVALAAAAFAAAYDPTAAFDFHDLPAMYQEVPFYIPTLGGADRYLTWRFDCWIASLHSFDDTTYRLAPQVVPASETLLAQAGAFMRAACVPPPAARPDLVPSRLSASYGGGSGCGPFGSLSVCVANRGSAAAPAFAVAVEPGTPLDFPPLAAGEEACASEPLPPAVSFFTVRADPGAEVDELVEINNVLATSVARPTIPATCSPTRTPSGSPTPSATPAPPTRTPFPTRSPTVTRTPTASRTATRTRRSPLSATVTPPTTTPRCAPTATLSRQGAKDAKSISSGNRRGFDLASLAPWRPTYWRLEMEPDLIGRFLVTA